MPTNAKTPNRRRLWQMIGATGILLIPLLVIWWPGCRQYPAVTSKDSLGLIKLLYAACNTKDPARLARVEQGMEMTTREGKMSPAEQEAFAKIIGMAKAGREGGVQVRSGSGRPGVINNPCARTTRQEIAEAVTTRPVQYEPRLGPDKITLPLHARPTTLTTVEKSTQELFPQYLNFGFLLFS